MKIYKQIIFWLLTGVYLLLPEITLAEDNYMPSFFVRIPNQSYVETPYSERLFFDEENTTTYYVNGVKHQTNLPMLIEQGRTLLPLRLTGEACGAEVVWDNRNKTASITLDEQTAVMRLADKNLLIGNEIRTMEIAPILENGSLYLPLRNIAEALGRQVNWQNKLGQSFISVSNTEQNFTSRNQFNRLLSQTYLQYLANTQPPRKLLDVGQACFFTTDNDNTVYRNGINIQENVSWYDFDGRFPKETAAMATKLNCTFKFCSPPSPNPEIFAVFYDDGDIKVIYDVPAYHSFDAFIYGNYAYIIEKNSSEDDKFLRIDLTTPRDQYFAQEVITYADLPKQ